VNGAQKIPWKRLAVEAVAIVASILLAFAIDAWWQRRSELDRADALVASLYADFQTSQADLDRWLAGNRWMFRTSSELLSLITNADTDEVILVPLELIVGSVGSPTYSPTESTLEAAVSSGQINLIEDTELRNVLAHWRQLLADTSEDEELIRVLVIHQLVPAFADQIRLGRAFDFDNLAGKFFSQSHTIQDEQIRLRATTKLEGALAERVFYATFVVRGLAEIHDTQAKVLQLLEAHLNE
jgi:hypothetical protein